MLTPSFVSSIEPPTAIHEVVTTDELAKRIQACSQGKFTGRLDLLIQDAKGQQWSLYFHQGGLIWGTSDIHPNRRWYRQLTLHCPQLASKVHSPLVLTGTTTHHLATPPQPFLESQYMDYDSLVELMRQGKILQEQMKKVIEGSIAEILFDIHQRWERLRYRSGLKLTYRPVTEDAVRSTLALIPVSPIWQRTVQDWEIWRQAGLVDCFPNRAPVIWKAEELQQHTSPVAYQNLSRLVDGHQTLRDLAVQLKQHLLPLTESLMPFVRKGLMGLLDVEDFQVSARPSIANSPGPALVTFP
ncbi:MAG TPA: response regulator, partial [Coleofasciculaceae cyanobacterium]